MPAHKVIQRTAGDKVEPEYDHYIALDWSLKIMAIAHMSRHETTPRVFERPASLKELKTYLGSLKGRVILTFEESGFAHWLYLELLDEVDRIIICDPFKNKLLQHGPKTDKIDARKLCQLLRAGLLTEVFHSTSGLYELRLLVSAYDDVVRAGIRLLNQQAALKLTHRDTGKTASFIGRFLTENIDLYRKSKEQYERRFRESARRNSLVRFQQQLPGIGTIGAVKIVACVVDPRRFPYAVYKTAALAAINGKNSIREYYDQLLAQGVAEHNARHAVARYIARTSLGMLKTGTRYEPYRWRDAQNKDS